MVFPKKNKFYPRSTAQPVLPLLPESLPSSEETKQAFITMELFTKAGEKGKEAQTYKKAIRRFKEGSCQEWIEFLDNITEVFKQNSISEPSDKIAVIRSVLGGNSRSSFDVALEDLQIAPKEGETEPKLTEEMIEFALEAVAITIFPKKALTTQKRWMQHELKKPVDLPVRKLASAITRLNNALPHFPGATETDKFPPEKIVEILEYSIPAKWRTALDLKGFDSTEKTKAELILECEALERSEQANKANGNHEFNNNKKRGKKRNSADFDSETSSNGQNNSSNGNGNGNGNERTFYCKVHGPCASHPSKKCFVLHPELRKRVGKDGKTTAAVKSSTRFNQKTFEKELHTMSVRTGKSEAALLEKYGNCVARAKNKLAKSCETDNDSEDMSVQCMDLDAPIPKKVRFNPIKPPGPLRHFGKAAADRHLIQFGKVMEAKKKAWKAAMEQNFVTETEPDSSDEESSNKEEKTPSEMLAEEREFLQKVHRIEAKGQEE